SPSPQSVQQLIVAARKRAAFLMQSSQADASDAPRRTRKPCIGPRRPMRLKRRSGVFLEDDQLHFGPCLKYRKSGGGWPSLAGIKRPSLRSTYISLPMATNPDPSTQLFSRQLGRGFELCTYFLSTVQGRVKAWSITVTSS